jgi:hypothetical protein
VAGTPGAALGRDIYQASGGWAGARLGLSQGRPFFGRDPHAAPFHKRGPIACVPAPPPRATAAAPPRRTSGSRERGPRRHAGTPAAPCRRPPAPCSPPQHSPRQRPPAIAGDAPRPQVGVALDPGRSGAPSRTCRDWRAPPSSAAPAPATPGLPRCCCSSWGSRGHRRGARRRPRSPARRRRAGRDGRPGAALPAARRQWGARRCRAPRRPLTQGSQTPTRACEAARR